MIYGAAAWGFRETGLEQQLALMKKYGLAELELSIAGHPNDCLQLGCTSAEIAQVKKLYAEYGIGLSATSASNDFTFAEPEKCREQLRDICLKLEIAGRLGAKHVRVFAGFSPAAEVSNARWELMIDCLRQAAVAAEKNGVRIAVETHGGVESCGGGVRHFHSTSSRPDLLEKMMGELPTEVGLVFDPGNLGAVGLDTDEVISLYRQYRNRICYFHLKDFAPLSTGGLLPCACGDGKLDWSKLAVVFAEFPGVGLIEYELPEDVEDGLRRSLSALESAVNAATPD
jgi:sugar phosphate isomerase/epimerase